MALIYKCLRPNNRDTSVKHPLMAFKMSPDCYPASLKSLCVNKLWSLPSRYHKQNLWVKKPIMCTVNTAATSSV